MNDRFNIRYFNKNSKEFEYLKIGAVNFILFTDCTIYEQGQFCTGLKDKNGKLIYEGDIVRYKDEVYDLCIGRIEWDNAHYELQYYTGEKYGWFSHILCIKHIKNMEVIGNIYENKELLEEYRHE